MKIRYFLFITQRIIFCTITIKITYFYFFLYIYSFQQWFFIKGGLQFDANCSNRTFSKAILTENNFELKCSLLNLIELHG